MNAIAPELFQELGASILRKRISETETFRRLWANKFGASPSMCSILWVRLEDEREHEMPNNPQPKHLLWALMLLRTYADEPDMAKDAGGEDGGRVDPKTFRKWSWHFVRGLSFLEPLVIRWENRFNNDIYNDSTVSVDGTDTRVPSYRPFWKGWFSHKFNGPGTRWEIGLSIRSRDIVWVHGPFPCGRWPDLKIFRHAMKSFLHDNEKAEADDGYVGEPTKILTPEVNSRTAADVELRQCVRNRHETINRRLKEWKCIKECLKHSLDKHSAMFRAVAVIVQLSVENGELTLFDVDYDDRHFSMPAGYA